MADPPTKKVVLDLDCAKEQQYQIKAKDVKHDADTQVSDFVLLLAKSEYH